MPEFKSYNKNLLIPEMGTCHKIRRVSKPENWEKLPFFNQRTDLIDPVHYPKVKDTIILAAWDAGEISYFQIKALRG